MTDTALITGATAGLGAEFARQLAADGHRLVLVARDEARLREKAAALSAEFGVETEVLPADLSTEEGIAAVAARLGEQEAVTLLVNNAGFGLAKWFTDNPVEDERTHLKVLVQAPMELCHAALTAMQRRGSGGIINVASVAGFLPRGTYSAAKAWLINFSRWANNFYAPHGIHVTAVCPGFVHTEFHQRMGADMGGIPSWMWLWPERVVREGLRDARAGKSVSIPSRRYKVLARIPAVVPEALMTKLASRGR